MTPEEHTAISLLAKTWNAMIACDVADAEAAAHIHALQHAVMAQATRRAHPEIFRQRPPRFAAKRDSDR